MIDKIYIIHYTKLKERREHIESIVSKYNIPYEFITEYDQEDLEYVKSKYYNLDIDEYNKKIEIYNRTKHGIPPFRKLSDAEISCTIKHIIAIKKLSEECNIGLILEDDAIPYNDSFIDLAEKSIKESPDNWGSIFIGNGCGDEFIKQKSKYRINENLFSVPHPATNCAEAYILNKQSAEKLYNSMLPFQQISDWELACSFWLQSIDVFWRIPSLIYQGSISGEFKSSLR